MVTTCFLYRIADLMTAAWKVYGIKLMIRSCWATAASRAWSSVTSKAIGFASCTPSESFAALSMFLQARNVQSVASCCAGQFIPTVTLMPDSVRISSVGFATNPEPLEID